MIFKHKFFVDSRNRKLFTKPNKGLRKGTKSITILYLVRYE